MRKILAGVGSCLAVLLALGGCGGTQAAKKPVSTPSSHSPSPSPTSSPTPKRQAIPTAAPAQQLTFSFPKAKGAAERSALITSLAFLQGWFQTLRTARVSPTVRKLGDKDVLATARHNVDYLHSHGSHYGGPIHVTVTDLGAGRHAAVVKVCSDASRAHRVVHGKTKPIVPPVRQPGTITLTKSASSWRISGFEIANTSC